MTRFFHLWMSVETNKITGANLFSSKTLFYHFFCQDYIEQLLTTVILMIVVVKSNQLLKTFSYRSKETMLVRNVSNVIERHDLFDRSLEDQEFI